MKWLLKAYSLVLIAVVVLTTNGCAINRVKPTPQAAAAKTLLSARQAVIGTATTLSALCQQKVIKADTCMKIADNYAKAEAAYNVASDLEMAAFAPAAAPDALQKYQVASSQLFTLMMDLQTLNNKFGGGEVK